MSMAGKHLGMEDERFMPFLDMVKIFNLIEAKGPVQFLCGGWECQSMSMAGKHLGMEDARFMPFLDMVKICNYLQRTNNCAVVPV